MPKAAGELGAAAPGTALGWPEGAGKVSRESGWARMARCSVEFPSSVGADGVAKRLALPFQARGPRRCEPAVPKESSLANPQPPRSTPTWSNMRISTAHSRASVSAYRCWRMASSLPMCCRARSSTDTPTKLGPRNESGHWAGSCPSSPRPLPLHHPRNQSRFSVKASRRARLLSLGALHHLREPAEHRRACRPPELAPQVPSPLAYHRLRRKIPSRLRRWWLDRFPPVQVVHRVLQLWV